MPAHPSGNDAAIGRIGDRVDHDRKVAFETCYPSRVSLESACANEQTTEMIDPSAGMSVEGLVAE